MKKEERSSIEKDLPPVPLPISSSAWSLLREIPLTSGDSGSDDSEDNESVFGTTRSLNGLLNESHDTYVTLSIRPFGFKLTLVGYSFRLPEVRSSRPKNVYAEAAQEKFKSKAETVNAEWYRRKSSRAKENIEKGRKKEKIKLSDAIFLPLVLDRPVMADITNCYLSPK